MQGERKVLLCEVSKVLLRKVSEVLQCKGSRVQQCKGSTRFPGKEGPGRQEEVTERRAGVARNSLGATQPA